ncbi:MAG: cytochrome c, partial [Gammaproteobacteria bacterium]|nr:cytochrome c [Gammaproteobacteria bacterium]
MNNNLKILLATGTLIAGVPQAAADFHLWSINEVFTTADGTIQFIELTTSATGQNNLNGHTLVSSGTGVDPVTYNFDSNLSGETADSTVLLATQEFATQTGLQPDYIIPDNFIAVTGGTLNFGEGTDTLAYNKEQLPLNGSQSIDGGGAAQSASPLNFSNLPATVAVDSYSSFDAATGIMNVPMLDVPGVGIANVSFSVNLAAVEFTLLDGFYLYGAGISAGATSAQFQNGSTLYIPGLTVGDERYEFNLSIVNSDPIVFGNPQVLGVTNVMAEPEPEPEPDPQVSIDQGQSEYALHCEVCHSAGGSGGIGPNLQNRSYTFASLRDRIDLTMPRGTAINCED